MGDEATADLFDFSVPIPNGRQGRQRLRVVLGPGFRPRGCVLAMEGSHQRARGLLPHQEAARTHTELLLWASLLPLGGLMTN